MSDSTYTRPLPPPALRQRGLGFARDEEAEQVIREDFVTRSGIFYDPEHAHLQRATVGFLWAASKHVVRGQVKGGTAELVSRGEPTTWAGAQRRVLLHQLFGADLPTFLITLAGLYAVKLDDRGFFALLDHEVLHCGHARDRFGAPRWNTRTGDPVWCTRPHAYEGFPGTVERWGAAADAGAAEIVRAGTRPRPRFHGVPGREFNPATACGHR